MILFALIYNNVGKIKKTDSKQCCLWAEDTAGLTIYVCQ